MNNAVVSDMTNRVSDITIDTKQTDGVGEQDETTWMNDNWGKEWGYFTQIPDLQSALLMKSVWNCGKGWTADAETQVILEHITGWGKDTFDDILYNMDLIKNIGGDSFAEIIKDEDTGILINLKPLDPSSIRIVVGRDGIIKRYEQVSKLKNAPKKFNPEDIFHLSNDRLADQIHGISKILALEQTILADNESFVDLKKLMHHQVKPFFIWKLKTDDPVKIAAFVQKIDSARNLGEDVFVPDDEDLVSFERVELNVSEIVLRWRDDIRNKFYRSIGLPQIVPGAGGQSTESESKVIYLAFEQLVEKEQRYLEMQLWQQLQLKINLIPPATLQQNLQADSQKDASQGIGFQQGEMQAGVGE